MDEDPREPDAARRLTTGGPEPAPRRLGALGLDATAEAIYLALLRGEADHTQLARSLMLSESAVALAINGLTAVGLIAHSGDGTRWRAVNPEVALKAVRNAREVELLRAREDLARLDVEIGTFLSELRDVGDFESLGRVVRGASAFLHCIEELYGVAGDRIEALLTTGVPPALLQQARRRDEAALGRGVRMRVVVPEAWRNDQAARSYGEWFVAAGGELGTLVAPPVEFINVDHSHLVLPLVPGERSAGVVLVESRGVTALAVAFFERLWDEALAWAQAPVPRAEGGEPSAKEVEVLRLMMRGNPDAAIARQLSVSERTVRRIVAELCARENVSSRFALGALAAARGWIHAGQRA